MNHFCQLLNIHGINGVKKTEMHVADTLVSKLSSFEVEIDTEEMKIWNLEVLIKFWQN
jgi:hypothetical protein